jgi:hypothetical protein
MRGLFRGRFGALHIVVFAAAMLAIFLASLDCATAANGDWKLQKSADKSTFATAGEVITYTYVIVNNRGQDGQLDSLTDDKATIIY